MMNLVIVLKIASIIFAILGAATALRARSIPAGAPNDCDSARRHHYIASYALTSISMLLLAAIGFI